MRRSTRRLLLGVLIYALLFAAALAVFLHRFDGYLAAYEASRPEHAAERFPDEMTDAELDALTAETLASLNPALNPADECRARLREVLRGAERVREGELSWLLLDGEHLLCRVTLAPDGEDEHGFTRWRPELSEPDFSHLLASARCTVPADWTVLCRGAALGEDCVADKAVRWALLEEFYDSEELPAPFLWTYDTGLCLGEPELSFLDGSGRSVSADELSEERFADNCSEADAQALRALAELFMERYIAYSSNAGGNASGNYQKLEELMVKGSTLQKRMRYAVAGLYWSQGERDRLRELEYFHLTDLGNGYYLIDLRYTVETTGRYGTLVTDNKLKLIAVRSGEGTLLMTAMSSY